MSDTDEHATNAGASSTLAHSRAVNINTDTNSVRAVVGGPLCDTGLPFGHTVICGDRGGRLTLRNAVSGLERKHLATTYHGHGNTVSGSCSGSLPTCGEMVAVTVAEVVIAPDDGSPTLWIGCADGSVQVYFLGGHQNQQQQQRHKNGVSPSGRVRSPTGGRHATPSRAGTEAAAVSSPLGDDIAQSLHQHLHSAACRSCGSPIAAASGAGSVASPPSGGARRGATTPLRTASTLGGASGVRPAASPLSPIHASARHPATASTAGSALFRASGSTATARRGVAAAAATASGSGGGAAHSSESITADGSVLLFAEKRHNGAVQALVSAPSIGSVFTGGADWLIVRWRTHGPIGFVAPVGRHARSIRSLAFAPGTPCILISGADDGVIKLWSSRQKKPTDLSGHRGAVLHAAPWYDTIGLFGDVVSTAVAAATTAASNASGIGPSPAFQQQQQQQHQAQQQQKAIGVISCGEDGTMRLWAADSTVANTVVRVSRLPVVRCQIFSDNLVAAFSKDGAAAVYHVAEFPHGAQLIYRFDNVGQVHRALATATTTAGGAINNSSARGRLSHYLHDVKVLAHINGLLVWSLTSGGARLSMLPLQHFEAATKRQLQTVGEKRRMLEGLLAETLDDADSTVSGAGHLLFQRLLDGSVDVASLTGGHQHSGAHATLLQLARMQQQQQTSNASAAAAADTWQFDHADADLELDPGQLSAAETSASSLRALTRAVNAALFEMSRLLGEFHGLKMELQTASFVKVMETTRRHTHDYLRRELDALSVRQKEIAAAEREMMAHDAAESVAGSVAPSVAPAKGSAAALGAAAAAAAMKAKVNPRKQIADMLGEMLSGKRTAIQTRSSPATATASPTLSSGLHSSPSSLPSDAAPPSVQVPANAKATLGDEERGLIDGLQRSVTGEGAASYLYAYIAAKQFLASEQAQQAMVAIRERQAQLAAAAQDKAVEQERLKAEREAASAAAADAKRAQKEKAALLEMEELKLKRGELVDAAAATAKVQAEADAAKKALERANAEIAALRRKNYEWEEKHAAALEKHKELEAKIPKEPPKLKPMTAEDRADRESRTTGAFAPTTPNVDADGAAGGGGGGTASGEPEATGTGPAPALQSLASLSLVVTCDKKLLRGKFGKPGADAGGGEGTAEAAGGAGSAAAAPKKRKRGPNDKSDEDDVAAKKDTVADQVVVTLPGVGSWGGAERRTIATQTKWVVRAAAAAQVNTVTVDCLPPAEREKLQEQARLLAEALRNSSNRDQDEDERSKLGDTAPPPRYRSPTRYQLVKGQAPQSGTTIIPVTLPAGWTEDDFELIRESEEFLGLASEFQSPASAARRSNNTANIGAGASAGNALSPNDVSGAGLLHGGASALAHDDPRLAEVSATVAATMGQLKQLERLRQGTQSSMAALADAAFVSGLPLDDPRVRGEMDRLEREEQLLAEEMHRLHHILVAPASPIPAQRPYRSRYLPHDASADALTAQRRDELAGGSNRSLMSEFHLLMSSEKARINSSSPSRGAMLE